MGRVYTTCCDCSIPLGWKYRTEQWLFEFEGATSHVRVLTKSDTTALLHQKDTHALRGRGVALRLSLLRSGVMRSRSPRTTSVAVGSSHPSARIPSA